jgi:hypothetical protein
VSADKNWQGNFQTEKLDVSFSVSSEIRRAHWRSRLLRDPTIECLPRHTHSALNDDARDFAGLNHFICLGNAEPDQLGNSGDTQQNRTDVIAHWCLWDKFRNG